MKKGTYLTFTILGLALPYYFLFQFLRVNGFDIPFLIENLFANSISTFFAVDLIISIVVFWFYLYQESKKYQMKNAWVYVLASLTVGLSFALPLFLYVREDYIQN